MNVAIEAINRAGEAWWTYALHTTWTSSLVAVILLVTIRLARRWPARVRFALLMIALVKFVIPPMLTLPVGLFSWFGPTVVQNAAVVEQSASENSDGAEAAKWGGAGGVFSSIAEMSWKAWGMLLHGWGVLVMAGAITVQFVKMTRISRGAQEVRCGPVYQQMLRLSNRLGIRRRVRLLVTSRPAPPMAFGLRRPCILIPVSVHNRLPAHQVETILAHELVHHRCGDLWLNWIEILIGVVWWFNPVVRRLNRTLRQTSEDCCDDFLLSREMTTSEKYCQALLTVAADLGRRHMLGAALGFADRLHPLGMRMKRIMDPHVRRPSKLPLLTLAPVVVLAALVLPGLPSEARTIAASPAPAPGFNEANAGQIAISTSVGKSLPKIRPASESVLTADAGPALPEYLDRRSERWALGNNNKPATASSRSGSNRPAGDKTSQDTRLAGNAAREDLFPQYVNPITPGWTYTEQDGLFGAGKSFAEFAPLSQPYRGGAIPPLPEQLKSMRGGEGFADGSPKGGSQPMHGPDGGKGRNGTDVPGLPGKRDGSGGYAPMLAKRKPLEIITDSLALALLETAGTKAAESYTTLPCCSVGGGSSDSPIILASSYSRYPALALADMTAGRVFEDDNTSRDTGDSSYAGGADSYGDPAGYPITFSVTPDPLTIWPLAFGAIMLLRRRRA